MLIQKYFSVRMTSLYNFRIVLKCKSKQFYESIKCLNDETLV